MKKTAKKKLGDITTQEIVQVRDRLNKSIKNCFKCSFRCNNVISADACLIYDIILKKRIEDNKKKRT